MSNYWLIIVGYLIGSIPFSYIVGRLWAGIDIRRCGSGNVGMTNVWRNAGPAAGLTALVLDLGKGMLAVWLAGQYGSDLVVALSGLAVLIGHSWPVFLGFKGGKLVATGVGVITAISPSVGISTMLLWILVTVITRYVSVGSIIAIAAIPFLMIAFSLEPPYLALGAFAAIFAVYKHIPNIKRLIAGTEPKVVFKKR
ncbi:MAG: glycerol-3-phosphate 1-O-acyltransferase PlsY [Desulfotomaculaceae bacterium]|nr:glycerol-3-phosphate 1-O-acyltransferase PlsY [Desulfotomaculaceae bacterium]MDD4766180.1 glycerol-3-phosphate 1-O-acyltransferase PlsY [Desulfotomaculaceae bacterium]